MIENANIQQSAETLSRRQREALFEYLLYIGDDLLVLGHRVSEWCGHGPTLEEDIALGNIALDCLGQASAFLQCAAALEDEGRTEDDLAFLRNAPEFRNCLLVEQTNGDFAKTIVRHLFYSLYLYELYTSLAESSFSPLAELALRSRKETTYHVRHSSEWLIRLGQGTEESQRRVVDAIGNLRPFCEELFISTETETALLQDKICADVSALKNSWLHSLQDVMNKAGLENRAATPSDSTASGRNGRHTEHLLQLLAEMQVVARTFPKAKW